MIVVNEVFGLHDYILDICRRFAKLGYVAIAPGFFDRAGDPAPIPMTQFGDIMKIVGTATDQQVMSDVDATLKFLEAQPYVDRHKLAITGFCWGGKVVWNACETYRGLQGRRRLVRPHGADRRRDRPTRPEPRLWPIDHAAELHAPGARPLRRQGRRSARPCRPCATALKAAGKTGERASSSIPDASHGFHADYRASYDEADAKDGWSRLLAFFAANGVAPAAA